MNAARLCKDCGQPGKRGNPLMKEGLHSDWVDCINTLKARCLALEDEVEVKADALGKIKQWAEAYPVDVFPEPDFDRVREALEAAGLSLDQVSASCMRHVITQVQAIVDQAMGDTNEKAQA